MSAETQIDLIKTQTLARIVEITAEQKPSYDIGGQKVSWTEYLKQLQGTVEWCDEQLGTEETFEIEQQGYT